MSYIISYIDSLDTNFKRDFFAYCQEPKQHSIGFSEKIRISGWALQKDEPKEIKILAISNSSEYNAPVSLHRKDVIENYGKANQFFSKQELCGFEIQIPRSHQAQTIQISIIKDNTHYPWFTLVVSPDVNLVEKAKSAWKKYCLSKPQEIDKDEVYAFEKIGNNEKKSIIIGSPITAYNAEQLVSYAKIPIEYSHAVYDFFSYIQNQNSISSIILNLVNSNKLIITSPLGPGAAYCTESFVFNKNITILKFNNSDNEVFLIFQSISFCDGIYFPLRGVYVAFQDLDILSVQNYLISALQNFNKIISYSIHSNKNNFSGLITGHNRPYHYFYNHLPSLEKLSEDNILSKIKNFLFFPGCNYLKLNEIFPEITAAEKAITNPALDHFIDNNEFACQIGFKFLNHDKPAIKTIENLDLKLKKLGQSISSKDAFEPTFKSKNISLKNFFPIIWFGVMSQKRCWIEQIPAAIELLNELKKSFPSIAVVFDGWTSPLTPTETDKEEIQKDLLLTEDIIRALDHGIFTLNAVGFNAIQKIHIANQVDCFIGNGAAGVLFVDRIANRYGIGHLNKEMLKSPLYLHKNITLIPPEQINDIQKSDRSDYVSYSINPEFVQGLVKKILIEHSVTQRLLETDQKVL
ncbi:hypothetical protein [Azotobacter beijerinckii]|uniref:Uncharacterized protein n=1 Tax=Azotobacter beijerinckii TaxID=170623 RepID=A0A1I3ZVH1_9GAMM|nr:hypothetical protein [Azotobacter beijerinckii]SFA85668.1 hypothetical protein SAMN04244571_00593 [Azotobacter beijerinckii]SFK47529.1 hypothetical protein SAMN04244574_00741 [Azotobacter beijerinckii]